MKTDDSKIYRKNTRHFKKILDYIKALFKGNQKITIVIVILLIIAAATTSIIILNFSKSKVVVNDEIKNSYIPVITEEIADTSPAPTITAAVYTESPILTKKPYITQPPLANYKILDSHKIPDINIKNVESAKLSTRINPGIRTDYDLDKADIEQISNWLKDNLKLYTSQLSSSLCVYDLSKPAISIKLKDGPGVIIKYEIYIGVIVTYDGANFLCESPELLSYMTTGWKKMFNETKAISIICSEFPDFPPTPSVPVTKLLPVGKSGLTANVIFTTNVEKVSDEEYIITLTKDWGITVGNTYVKSFWKYRVLADGGFKIEESDKDYLVNQM